MRFKSHGLAPKSAADFAFLLHGFHHLKDEGVMAIGVISNDEFGMTNGLNFVIRTSAFALCPILVLKKCKKPNDVLFINASGPENFDKGKRQNQLSKQHIAKIIDTYQFRKEEPRYSRRVEMDEIEKNDFNLNISRYISTAVGEVEISLEATHSSLVETEKSIRETTAKHNKFLKELGLPLLP